VSKWLTLEHVLVANLNVNILVKLVKFLNRNFHVLSVPLRVLTTIVANVGSPFLSLTNLNPDEGILLVHRATTVDIKVCILNVKS
jgi:hypothetical protein